MSDVNQDESKTARVAAGRRIKFVPRYAELHVKYHRTSRGGLGSTRRFVYPRKPESGKV